MSKDRPGILMRRNPFGLAPVSIVDDEWLSEYKLGSVVEVTVRQRRSGPNHRHYWVVLGELVKSGAVPYTDACELDEALKLACGVTKLTRTLDGKYVVRPGSISYSARDEGAFVAYKKRAWAALAQQYGLDVDALEAEHAA